MIEPYENKNNIDKYDEIRSVLVYSNNIQNDESFLTIVIPTYKRDELLIRAINSIINQKFTVNFQIIVVDNDFRSIKDTKLEHFFDTIKCVSLKYFQNERNIGLFGNWNRCFELANTKWVAMLHDDDYLSDNYFINLSNIIPLLNNKIGYIKSATLDTSCKNAVGLIKFNKIDFYLFGPCRIGCLGAPSCGSIFNREAFIKVGGFDETHYPSEDAYFIARLCVKGNYDIYMTSVPMGVIDHDDSLTYKKQTIISFANEFSPYLDYYSTWGKVTYVIYRFFYKELFIQEKKQIYELIEGNQNIEDKHALLQIIDSILEPNSYSKLKYILLKIIYKLHYFNIKYRTVCKTKHIKY